MQRSEELLAGGPDVGFTEPTYSSEGALLALHRQLSPSDPEERASVFYFTGRPVAHLRQQIGGPSSLLFLSTDHLGIPVLGTAVTADEVWHGPFEPFGADYFRGSSEWALANGVFLRFPGQWEDETRERSTLGENAYYNVLPWYHHGNGRYTRPDPMGLRGDPHPYAFAASNPLLFAVLLGLKSRSCCTTVADSPILSDFYHCFIEVEDDITQEQHTYSLHGMGDKTLGLRRSWGGPLGCTFEDDSFDRVRQQFNDYPQVSNYRLLGPKSNTFAGHVTTACGLQPPPIVGAGPGFFLLRPTHGWDQPRPEGIPRGHVLAGMLCPRKRFQ